MSINKLSDGELVKEYKVAKMSFVFAEEFSKEEIEAEEKFDSLWQEIQKRDIDLRNYIQ